MDCLTGGYLRAAGPVVRRGDDEWFSIVRWTLFAMLNAEEMGINSQNVDEKAANPATPDMAHIYAG